MGIRGRYWVSKCVCVRERERERERETETERDRVRVWELNEAFRDINERKERKQRIESWIPLRGGLNCRKNNHDFDTNKRLCRKM